MRNYLIPAVPRPPTAPKAIASCPYTITDKYSNGALTESNEDSQTSSLPLITAAAASKFTDLRCYDNKEDKDDHSKKADKQQLYHCSNAAPPKYTAAQREANAFFCPYDLLDAPSEADVQEKLKLKQKKRQEQSPPWIYSHKTSACTVDLPRISLRNVRRLEDKKPSASNKKKSIEEEEWPSTQSASVEELLSELINRKPSEVPTEAARLAGSVSPNTEPSVRAKKSPSPQRTTKLVLRLPKVKQSNTSSPVPEAAQAPKPTESMDVTPVKKSEDTSVDVDVDDDYYMQKVMEMHNSAAAPQMAALPCRPYEFDVFQILLGDTPEKPAAAPIMEPSPPTQPRASTLQSAVVNKPPSRMRNQIKPDPIPTDLLALPEKKSHTTSLKLPSLAADGQVVKVNSTVSSQGEMKRRQSNMSTQTQTEQLGNATPPTDPLTQEEEIIMLLNDLISQYPTVEEMRKSLTPPTHSVEGDVSVWNESEAAAAVDVAYIDLDGFESLQDYDTVVVPQRLDYVDEGKVWGPKVRRESLSDIVSVSAASLSITAELEEDVKGPYPTRNIRASVYE